MPQSDSRQSGIARIERAFRAAKAEGRAALMPYFPLGYPDRALSSEIVASIASYSDLLELGIPFSDPLADGPTIQRSTQIALEQGATSSSCLDQLHGLRARGITVPALLMGYYNPILSFGEDAFVRAAKSAGADGFIVPDLPPDEAAEFGAMAESAGLALIHMLAPTSDDERMMKVIESARGFIYLVSLTGVTGARTDVQRGLAGFVDRVRSKTTTPLAVGFGISTPQQVRQVGEMADGVIVGSALIDAVDRAADSAGAAGSYVRSLRAALHQEK